MYRFSIAALIFVTLSCGKDNAVAITDADATIKAWLDSMNITATRDDSGIYYYATTTNAAGAAVTSGSVASIYYTLSDLDGNGIASHQRANGDSLVLKQGVGAVYPVGLDIGLAFMRVGETFNFILPPSQGYSQLTSGAIDPSLITVLEVEVTSLDAEDDLFTQELVDITTFVAAQNLNDTVANPVNSVLTFASGVSFKRTAVGMGSVPLNGDTIVLNYTGRFLDNSTFTSATAFEFIFGSSEPRALIPGFEFGVSRMQTDEQSLVLIPSSQAYRESALVVPASITGDLINDSIIPDYVSTIPPYSTLIFDVTRVD